MTPTPANTDTLTLTYAIAYADMGWRVLPIRPGSKQPAIAEWPDKATTNHQQLEQWFGNGNPNSYGIGIATGPGSDLFVLDIDPAHGGDDTLHDLERANTPLPDTVEAITGSNGRHILFRWPDLTPDQRLGNSAGRLGPGLDIRAQGGQIVAAPTPHPTTGQAYTWNTEALPGSITLAPAPQWLLQLLLEDHQPLPEGQVDTGHDERFAWDHTNAKGNAYAQALLQAAGWHTPRTDRAGVTYLTRPGKGASEGNSCSIGKVAPGVTYIFTDQAPPLQGEKGYRNADLYAALHHGGDRKTADQALIDQSGLLPTHAINPADMDSYIADAKATAMALAKADATADALGEIREAHDFLNEPEPPYDWLVENLIERGDRLILTGPEGGGKSTLLRQMATQIAAGIHPFNTNGNTKANAGARVLIVDCENSPRQIRRHLRPLIELAGPRLQRDQLWIVPKPEGIDLALITDLAWLQAIAEEVQPELLIIGPIYKMSEGDPTEETTAKPIIRALDTLRAIHDCAILIEAHTPHEGKTERPYGASIWKRWPEFGLYLDRNGPLRHWRGARDEREWPAALQRGRGPLDWPWELATARDITFMAMMDVQRAAAHKLPLRAIADTLTAQGKGGANGVGKSTVDRAIKANLQQWNAMLEECGFEALQEVSDGDGR